MFRSDWNLPFPLAMPGSEVCKDEMLICNNMLINIWYINLLKQKAALVLCKKELGPITFEHFILNQEKLFNQFLKSVGTYKKNIPSTQFNLSIEFLICEGFSFEWEGFSF